MIGIFLLTGGCSDEKRPPAQPSKEKAVVIEDIPLPDFQEDSAYAFIEKQLSFGPRVPNTGGHIACANWLTKQFEKYGAKVTPQPTVVKAHNGDQLSIQNIIASYRPELKKRIMLSAHWDSRPIGDQDPDEAYRKEPIPGANDAGSGVGVLLEIARLLQIQQPEIGIDIFLWDAEDYGASAIQDSYCLGTQYWAKNKHQSDYQAIYGINLDMVGAANPYFSKEGYSMLYAPNVVEKVWKTAQRLGYGNMFVTHRTDPITDDHFYVNTVAKIPMIDIIDRPQGKSFFPQWHTHEDDLSVISKATLAAVGETLVEVIYREN